MRIEAMNADKALLEKALKYISKIDGGHKINKAKMMVAISEEILELETRIYKQSEFLKSLNS